MVVENVLEGGVDDLRLHEQVHHGLLHPPHGAVEQEWLVFTGADHPVVRGLFDLRRKCSKS